MNLRSLVWQNSPKGLLYLYADMVMLRNADRRFLAEKVIPNIPSSSKSKVLNIGVHYYTNSLHKQIVKNGHELYTIDIDEHKKKWGSPSRHVVSDAARLNRAFAGEKFDFIILFGVLGYGINTPDHRRETFASIREVMSENAILTIAWDENMSQDPMNDKYFSEIFQRNSNFLGGKRYRLSNGLYDREGVQSYKSFDFVSQRITS